MSNKISETIGLLRKLQNILPRPALLTIYKCLIRPHLDYGDIIYDQAYNLSFHQLESIQFNAALALTGAILDISSAILEWNKLDPSLRNSASYNVLKNSILKFIGPSPNKIF